MDTEVEGLKIVGEIGSLRLEPDDVLIFRTPDILSDENYRRLNDSLRKVFPGHKVLFLEEGASIEVARKAPPAAFAA